MRSQLCCNLGPAIPMLNLATARGRQAKQRMHCYDGSARTIHGHDTSVLTKHTPIAQVDAKRHSIVEIREVQSATFVCSRGRPAKALAILARRPRVHPKDWDKTCLSAHPCCAEHWWRNRLRPRKRRMQREKRRRKRKHKRERQRQQGRPLWMPFNKLGPTSRQAGWAQTSVSWRLVLH